MGKTTKALNFIEFLTLNRCAEIVSEYFGEELKEEDILQFALSGELQFSLDLLGGAYGIPGELVSKKVAEKIRRSETEDTTSDDNQPSKLVEDVIGQAILVGDDLYFLRKPEELVVEIAEVCELLMVHSGKHEVQRRLYLETGTDVGVARSGIYVRRKGTVYELQERIEFEAHRSGDKFFSTNNFLPCAEFNRFQLLVSRHEVERLAQEQGLELDTSLQGRRDDVLTAYLFGLGIKQQKPEGRLQMRKLDVWKILNEINPSLFPLRSESTVLDFFKKSPWKFRSGRQKTESV